MKYFSCFSGIEAASVAWKNLGWEAVGFSEIEPFPSAVLAHHFPNIKNYGDITKYNEWGIAPGTVDLVVGGSPCQAFSIAGLRQGLADPRGNLALVFLGLVDKLRPKWVIWENVPGVLSSNGGEDFAAFLSALGQLGYGWSYRVLDAQHFGVPQRRRRVFLVASRTGDWRPCAEILSVAEGLRGYIEAGGKEGKSPASNAGEGSEGNRGPWWNGEDRIPALTTKNADGDQRMPDKSTFGALIVPGPIVIDRAAFNQGENAQYEPHIEQTDVMDSLVARGPHAVGLPIPLDLRNATRDPEKYDEQNRQGVGVGDHGDPAHTLTKGFVHGVAVPYRKAKRAASTTDDESCVEGEVSNTLNNFDLGDTRTTHAVVEPIAFSAKDSGGDATQGISPTLRSQNSVEGNQNSSWSIAIVDTAQHCSEVAPTVTSSGPPYPRTGNERVEAEALVTQPITFQPGNLCREAGADPSTEATTTLKASAGDQMPHICYPLKDPNDIACDADRRQNGVGENGDPAFTLRTAVTPGVATSMVVRRLTPVECERLQGFPDNWTRIAWNGKAPEECPDGPRYKACGNSMAVPCMAWIGKRIAEYESRSNGSV